MKRMIHLLAIYCLCFQSAVAQDNFLWATGSSVGSYYNAAGYYTNNYMNPWPYSRTTMIPIVVGNEVTWKHFESSTASQIRSAGIKTDGTIWFWTKNSDPTKSAEPIQFGTETNWKQGAIANSSAFGGFHGLKNDGTLWSMQNETATPIQWETDNDWDSIVAWNSEFLIATKTDGTIWQLEANTQGVPVSVTQIGTDNDWKTIKVNSNGSLSFGLKNNGTLWKYNNSTSQFVQEGTDTDWISITDNGSIAMKQNGTIWGKGINNDGQLGLGNTNTIYEWTQIGTDTDWKQVSSRQSTTYAIKTDSTLWAWGDNSAYQLANGNNIDMLVPTQIGEDHSWLYVSATTLSAFALRTYGYNGPGGSTAAINETAFDGLILAPNPGTNEVTLTFNQAISGVQVDLIAVDGKIVPAAVNSSNSNTLTIETSNILPGMYLIRISQ
ncbi:MAG: T9SS type A sorting domain-containing protein, partial [Fluviicola sp.]|nr:T9SS type A sorting domain-containing protein [Fluviicola sp.]